MRMVMSQRDHTLRVRRKGMNPRRRSVPSAARASERQNSAS